jgi:hypothetical protein
VKLKSDRKFSMPLGHSTLFEQANDEPPRLRSGLHSKSLFPVRELQAGPSQEKSSRNLATPGPQFVKVPMAPEEDPGGIIVG